MTPLASFNDERATGYDKFIHRWIPMYPEIMALIPAIIKAEISQTDTNLLVAGCGTGNEIMRMKQAGFQGSIVGVDPSPDMVDLANEKLDGLENILLVRGDVKDLSPQPQFDLATLILVLHFLTDDGEKLKLLQDISQRLKKGAPFILVDIFGAKDRIRRNLKFLLEYFTPPNPREEAQERVQRIEERILYIPETRYEELFAEAGFVNTQRFFQHTIYGGWITYKA
ncbi:MAG: class I SAM-dependent methyltransferase [Bacteroidota bacterium]